MNMLAAWDEAMLAANARDRDEKERKLIDQVRTEAAEAISRLSDAVLYPRISLSVLLEASARIQSAIKAAQELDK
jgi:hypothetical protein